MQSKPNLKKWKCCSRKTLCFLCCNFRLLYFLQMYVHNTLCIYYTIRFTESVNPSSVVIKRERKAVSKAFMKLSMFCLIFLYYSLCPSYFLQETNFLLFDHFRNHVVVKDKRNYVYCFCVCTRVVTKNCSIVLITVECMSAFFFLLPSQIVYKHMCIKTEGNPNK